MLHFMLRMRNNRGDEGATAVEYGLMVAAIAAVIVAVVFLLGGVVKNKFSNTCAAINTNGTTTTSANC